MKLLRAPALHMALIGAALFGGGLFWGGITAERPRIVIPASRLDLVRQTFLQDHGRPPAREEWAGAVDALVDQEVLYQYAVRLKMYEEPAAQRRLAQIASFVETTRTRLGPTPSWRLRPSSSACTRATSSCGGSWPTEPGA